MHLPSSPCGGAVQIRRLDAGDAPAVQAWDAFVLAHPQATFFHRAGWQRILSQVLRHDCHFLYAEAQGSVQGVLPLAHVRSWLFGNALVGLPFAVYGGAVAASAEVARSLEAAAQSLARQLGVQHLELRHVVRRHRDWPMQELYVTFRKVLQPDDELRLQAIPRKQRAMVRKGQKGRLHSQVDADTVRFFALYANTMRRHGTPALPRHYFQALQAEFGPDCEVLTVQAPDGQPVSSVLSFYFRDEVLPYYAGDVPRARDLAANDYKYWALMCHASRRGAAVFDFGRSKQGTGSYAFKKNWGFSAEPLHYEYQLYLRNTVPQNNPSNRRWKPLITVWRYLPQSLVNWMGPHLVRGLG